MEPETAPSAENPPADGSAATANGLADVQGIAATLRSEMPEVQSHAVEAARSEAAASVGKDINGDSFNSATHVTGSDGQGKKNAKGAWEKKRGRKAGSSTAGNSAQSVQSRVGTGNTAPTAAGPTKEQLARQSGVGAANLFFVAGIILGGEEWQPQADPKIGLDEKLMMEGAFGDYFVATGKTDLPPGWALVAAVGMFAARRFTMPKTQSRFTKLKTWVGGKIYAFRMRKRKSTVQPYDKVDGEADPRDRRVWGGAGMPSNDASTV